jgi:hypothetical protein
MIQPKRFVDNNFTKNRKFLVNGKWKGGVRLIVTGNFVDLRVN